MWCPACASHVGERVSGKVLLEPVYFASVDIRNDLPFRVNSKSHGSSAARADSSRAGECNSTCGKLERGHASPAIRLLNPATWFVCLNEAQTGALITRSSPRPLPGHNVCQASARVRPAAHQSSHISISGLPLNETNQIL